MVRCFLVLAAQAIAQPSGANVGPLGTRDMTGKAKGYVTDDLRTTADGLSGDAAQVTNNIAGQATKATAHTYATCTCKCCEVATKDQCSKKTETVKTGSEELDEAQPLVNVQCADQCMIPRGTGVKLKGGEPVGVPVFCMNECEPVSPTVGGTCTRIPRETTVTAPGAAPAGSPSPAADHPPSSEDDEVMIPVRQPPTTTPRPVHETTTQGVPDLTNAKKALDDAKEAVNTAKKTQKRLEAIGKATEDKAKEGNKEAMKLDKMVQKMKTKLTLPETKQHGLLRAPVSHRPKGA
mmetsp:Transcript_88029/g.235492  ORF Transcript_88029/g.235492 Transcript_88029/m.235492 type:complete len:293 (-) Transcript_88029:217-1095(-)